MGVRDLTRMCELRDVEFDTGLDEATGLWVSSAEQPYVAARAPTVIVVAAFAVRVGPDSIDAVGGVRVANTKSTEEPRSCSCF